MRGGGSGAGSRLGRPVNQWPAADRSAWERAFADDDLLGGCAIAQRMAPRSRMTMETAYARWLAWLDSSCPASLAEPAGKRATRDRVLAYLHHLADERALSTVLNYACRLHTALQILAPGDDWSWLPDIIDTIERHVGRMPRPPRPFVEIDRLFAFGMELMRDAAGDTAATAIRRAEQFRDGLMIAFLAARPLRRQNMIELRLGTEIIETRDGYRVALPAEACKARRPLEFPLPATLRPCIDVYRAEHRPVLAAGGAAPGTSNLWLARSGAPFPSDSFADMITRRCRARFGVRLTPHDFRHCAASSIALEMPDDWPIIRVILGHTSLRTAEHHYIHLRGCAAAGQYQSVLTERRQQANQRLAAHHAGPDAG